MVLDVLGFTVLPAFLVAAAVMSVFTVLFKGKLAPLGAALAVALGVVAATWTSHNIHLTVDTEGNWLLKAAEKLVDIPVSLHLGRKGSAWNRLPLAALLALAVGLLTRPAFVPVELAWPLRAGAVALAATWAVPDHAVRELRWLPAAFVAVTLLNWALMEYLAKEIPGGGVALALSLVAFVGAFVLMQASYGRGLGAATGLSAALLGVAFFAAWGKVDASGAVPGAVVLLSGLLMAGKSETEVADLPWAAFAVVAVSPLVWSLTLLPRVRSWRGAKLNAVRFVLLLGVLGVAVALALKAGWPSFDTSSHS
jgi:hypothetical protein